MFPKCSLSEARSALSIAKGDMEEAVRLILEGDVQLSPTPHNVSLCYATVYTLCMYVTVCVSVWFDGVLLPQVNHGKSDSPQADQKLKESILEKWVWLLLSCVGQSCPLYFVSLFMTMFHLQRYMLVDREDDKKTHRPLAPKDVSSTLYSLRNSITQDIHAFYLFHAIQLAFWCDFYSLRRS